MNKSIRDFEKKLLNIGALKMEESGHWRFLKLVFQLNEHEIILTMVGGEYVAEYYNHYYVDGEETTSEELNNLIEYKGSLKVRPKTAQELQERVIETSFNINYINKPNYTFDIEKDPKNDSIFNKYISMFIKKREDHFIRTIDYILENCDNKEDYVLIVTLDSIRFGDENTINLKDFPTGTTIIYLKDILNNNELFDLYIKHSNRLKEKAK